MKIKFVKYTWIIIGLIFFAIGTIGAFLPILPTFPFYIVTLFCFARSSEKLHTWFVGTKLYKNNIEKIYSLIWPSPLITYFVVVSSLIPIGPRACSFCVEIPISPPKPNSPPSENLVEAFK